LSSAEHGSPTPILLTKARNDALVLGKVAGDAEVADDIVGFHAQQTVEKALKAVLETRGVDYPHTHDLARLFELLDDSGGAPGDSEEVLALTPWAAEFRYGDVVAGSLDRAHAVRVATATLKWAEGEIGAAD
jgi:HEPN domain-containing protein